MKHTVIYEGFTFVRIDSSKPRRAELAVETDRTYVLCPGEKIAINGNASVFHTGKFRETDGVHEALRLLGLITEERFLALEKNRKEKEKQSYRRRSIRDYKNAMDELDIEPSQSDLALFEELKE